MKKATFGFQGLGLLENYFKMAARTLLKNKVATSLNIAGLIIGIGGSFLIGLFIMDELEYDQHYPNKDRIYRITSTYQKAEIISNSAQSNGNIASILMQEVPEIKTVTRLMPGDEAFLFSQVASFKEDLIYTDSSFTKVFGIDLLLGSSSHCLVRPASLLISESMVIKLFGDNWRQKTILGEILSIDNRIPLTITGIFKDFPHNSHFKSDLFASVPPDVGDWMGANSKVYTYALLHEQARVENLNDKFQALSERFFPTEPDHEVHINFQPLTDIYLSSPLDDENAVKGSIKNIYALLLIAVFLMTITVINFVNLYTANSFYRLKEIGIRKAIGAGNFQLRYQFLLETALITIVALLAALVIAVLLLPTFNEFTDKNLSLKYFLNIKVFFLIGGITVIISLLAGFFPSLYLSRRSAIEALKGIKNKPTEMVGARTGLVMLQFVISCVMIILSIVAYKQVHLINNKDLGFDKEDILTISNPYMLGSIENIIRFRNELLTIPGIDQISVTGYTPSQSRWGSQRITFPDKDAYGSYSYPASWLTVDEGFIKTMGLSLTEGRDFHENHNTDAASVIINEKLVDQFKLNLKGESPIGTQLSFKNGYQNFTVIGVVNDFNFGSLHDPIKPTVMRLGYHRFEMALRLSPKYAEYETVNQINSIWKKNLPKIPFEYSFIRDRFDSLHKPDMSASKLFSIFCFLTVIMSTLGLFSIVTYTIARRTKEIGVRKVFGASEKSIVMLLANDFLKLILVSFVIALLPAWILAHKWIDDFAYKTEIPWWIFAISGFILLLVTSLTLGYQSVKASLANPIDILEQE